MQRIRTFFYVFSVVVTTALFTGCGQEEQAQSNAGTVQAIPVGVVTLNSKTVTLTKELPGRVVASQIAEIRPQVNGIIQNRLFIEGAEVEKGQALYQIESALFEAQVATSEAAIKKAEANIANTKARLQRYKNLLNTKAVSQQEYDEADAAFKSANADLLTTKAQLKTAQINLNYSKVLSPIRGQIGKSTVTAGALVNANQSVALATVTQLDPIYVDLTQSSNELTRLKQAIASGKLSRDADLHSSVELLLEDGSTYAHTGTLKFSEVTVDPSTGSVSLRAEFPNPDKLLLPGMYVRAVIVEGVKQNAILAPQRGISRNAKGQPTALVVSKENTVEPRVLVVDRTMGSKWLVSEGLSDGDKVIVEGLQKVRSGAPVKPVPAQSSNSAP
ncbi:efflux RND transporter periplasmic adaptor subunit [Thalassotalea hakodatensis]|uniref:efflux RND transporter periplasmic adaptor subunit n=1 Tax=Thalassotalea hakodatensis TaxID=3030492 RepID=UPI002572637E|nr:efflux RND transporter periplasmic adaptor subunit [Thalassotalea hakodatensis]